MAGPHHLVREEWMGPQVETLEELQGTSMGATHPAVADALRNLERSER
jgi:hypothetical protein